MYGNLKQTKSAENIQEPHRFIGPELPASPLLLKLLLFSTQQEPHFFCTGSPAS
jgi:hypothetical protein